MTWTITVNLCLNLKGILLSFVIPDIDPDKLSHKLSNCDFSSQE